MTRLLNRTGWVAAGVLTLLLVAALAGVIQAGPLDPPSGGPPAPTGPTQINSVPYTISAPGSYVLNRNVTLSAGAPACAPSIGPCAIQITADNVSLDLNGFTITGSGVMSIGSAGVMITSNNATVQNGAIAYFDSGIDGSNGAKEHLSGLSMSHTQGGIMLGNASVLSDCTVTDATAVGVYWGADSTIGGCTVTNSNQGFDLGPGANLSNCAVSHTTSVGITLAVSPGNGGSVRGCTVDSSGFTGISVANGAVVEGNVVRGTTGMPGAGIYVYGDGNRITGNVVTNNAGDGIYADTTADGNAITGNTASGNSGIGIEVRGAGNTLAENRVRGTLSSLSRGIYVPGTENRIEANDVSAFDWDWYVSGTNNLVMRNSAANAISGVFIGAGNTDGGTIGESWANITY